MLRSHPDVKSAAEPPIMRQRCISMIATCKCPVGGTQHVVCRYIEETGCVAAALSREN